MTTNADIPSGFWQQIAHQLERIQTEKPDTFDTLRAILLDPAYTDITAEINRNGEHTFSKNAAFFAGSGGDATLSLETIGWHLVSYEALYYYSVKHVRTGETLTYIEGDVLRGDQIKS